MEEESERKGERLSSCHLHLESLFEAYGIKLSLLKELTSLLLRDGVDVVTQQVASARKGKSKTGKKKQGSKKTADSTASAKYDIPNEHLSSVAEVTKGDHPSVVWQVPEAEERLYLPSPPPFSPATITKMTVEPTVLTTAHRSLEESYTSEVTVPRTNVAEQETENHLGGQNTTQAQWNEDEDSLERGGAAENVTLKTQEGARSLEESSLVEEAEVEHSPVHPDPGTDSPPLENTSPQVTEAPKKRKKEKYILEMSSSLELEKEYNSSEAVSKELQGPSKKRRGERKREKEASRENAEGLAASEEIPSTRVRRTTESQHLMVRSPGAFGVWEPLVEFSTSKQVRKSLCGCDRSSVSIAEKRMARYCWLDRLADKDVKGACNIGSVMVVIMPLPGSSRSCQKLYDISKQQASGLPVIGAPVQSCSVPYSFRCSSSIPLDRLIRGPAVQRELRSKNPAQRIQIFFFCKLRREKKDLLGSRAAKEKRGSQGNRENRENRAPRAPEVMKAKLAKRGSQESVSGALSARPGLQGRRGSLEHQDLRGHKASRVSVATRGFQGPREREVPLGYLGFQGKRNLRVTVTQAEISDLPNPYLMFTEFKE
ncbi:UNVERIFIED_CONTAM: hypothetical protein K2H54_077036 [Gekko kuhli]